MWEESERSTSEVAFMCHVDNLITGRVFMGFNGFMTWIFSAHKYKHTFPLKVQITDKVKLRVELAIYSRIYPLKVLNRIYFNSGPVCKMEPQE